jgi:hypothetical protein
VIDEKRLFAAAVSLVPLAYFLVLLQLVKTCANSPFCFALGATAFIILLLVWLVVAEFIIKVSLRRRGQGR